MGTRLIGISGISVLNRIRIRRIASIYKGDIVYYVQMAITWIMIQGDVKKLMAAQVSIRINRAAFSSIFNNMMLMFISFNIIN